MGHYRLITGIALLIGSYCLPNLIIANVAEPVRSTPSSPLKVTAAIPRYSPPTYSVDSQGNPHGFAIDVMEEVAKRANLQVTYEIKETWSDTIKALETGEVDLVPNMGITSTSSQMLIYSSPIEIINICVFVLRDNSKIKSLNDLSGATIAVVKENEAVNLLEKHKNVSIETFESPEHALFHLLSRQVDGLAHPQPPIWNLAQAISLDYRLTTLKPTLQKVPRAIAVHRDRPELRQRLDHALTELLPSSDYQQIYQRWYEPTPPITLSPLTLKLLGLLLVLTVIIIVLWRFYLLRSMYRLKQTQKALKKSEAQYRAIVEDQTELICRFLPDGTLTFVNEAYCRYFGQAREDILYTCFFASIPPENQSCLRHNLSRLSLETPVISRQHPVINGEGEKRWQYWINRGLFDETGNLVEIQGVGRDITEQKRIEEELADNLQQSQGLNHIIEHIHQSLDLESILTTATEKGRKILHSDRVAVYQFNADWSGEFIAESVDEKWLKLVSNNSKKVWEDTYLQETRGGRYKDHQSLRVDNIYTVGYQQCHIEFLEQLQAKAYMIAPLFVHHQLWGLLACYQNSHPRHWQSSELNLLNQIAQQLGLAIQQSELLQELETSKNSAEAASQAKSNFLAHMSHELRTPLNAILGFSQLLNNDQKLDKEQKEYIEIINESGEHLLTLIKSILDMAKIEAGEITLSYQSFNLHKLVKNLVQMFKLKAQSKGVDLIFDIADNIPDLIRSDSVKLRQILINLLNNAIKFTDKGKVIVRIKNHPEQKEREKLNLLFEIEDTGPGIDGEEFTYLFKPFFQTKLGRKTQEGTGLGLAISHEFVNLMGGKLQVSCPLQGGTIFHFILSVDVPQSSQEYQIDYQQKIVGLAPYQPTYRILIIEDNFANRKVLSNLLQPLGFLIKEASNGQEGVNLWETWHPDLIWMDLEMPVMDGYQATRMIRSKMKEIGSKKITKIIALTANVLAENREMILNIGCDDFVSKPFSESIIFEKLAQHLGISYRYDGNSINTLSPERKQINHLNHLKTQIQSLSPAWRDQLHQKAAAADGDSILQLVHELSPQYSDLCQEIIQLVESYSFDQLMEISH
ncbi:ATP-binding protein [Crocosphaera sp.]|uniref:ATP-binding protein n=1 Tax=Crocosphaera sp. TaxID=2729996 RepID=UPI003F25ED97|nr:transporter substrate-binding domain-containing protein [Crocosphaera sp.]